jgi:hypothetical protein
MANNKGNKQKKREISAQEDEVTPPPPPAKKIKNTRAFSQTPAPVSAASPKKPVTPRKAILPNLWAPVDHSFPDVSKSPLVHPKVMKLFAQVQV